MEKEVYYQPKLKDEEWGNLLWSFEVYFSKERCQLDFPDHEIVEYSGDDIEGKTYVDLSTEEVNYIQTVTDRVKKMVDTHLADKPDLTVKEIEIKATDDGKGKIAIEAMVKVVRAEPVVDLKITIDGKWGQDVEDAASQSLGAALNRQ